jgi:hypothetical protein
MSNRLIFLLAIRFGALEACGPSICCSCSQGSSGGPSPGKVAAVAGGTAAAGAAAAGLAAAGAATLATTGLVAFGATKAIKGFLNRRKNAKESADHDALISQNRDVAVARHSIPSSSGKTTGSVNLKFNTNISKTKSSNSLFVSSESSNYTPKRSTPITARWDERKTIGFSQGIQTRSSRNLGPRVSQKPIMSQLNKQSNTSYVKTTSSKESSMINRKNSTSKKENAKGNSSKGSTLIELIEDRHVDVM